MSLFAPFALLLLLITWIFLLAAAFASISLALGADYIPHVNSPLNAFYISSTSVLTIGFTSDFVPKTHAVKFLMLAGALLGMLLTASVVSLMFALISALQPRETLVSVISNLGGSPPAGIAILETYSRMRGRAFLHAFFDECHHWCADVLETHKSFPILPYFRSNDPLTSWVTSLGAVLDAAALLLSAGESDDENYFSARMTYLIGCKLLNEFALLFRLNLSEQEEISAADFHKLYVRLREAGYCTNNEETTKTNFIRLRMQYGPSHQALSGYLGVSYTPINSVYSPSLTVTSYRKAEKSECANS